MKKFTLALSCMLLPALVFASPYPDNDRPQYRKGGGLVRPDNYRDWVFLPSGFGMNYSPAAAPLTSSAMSLFRSGQTASLCSRGTGQTKPYSLWKNGWRKAEVPSQAAFVGLGIEVKLSEKWAYYSFARNRTGSANARQACFSCHEQHAAVEHTFVQFYPTLKPIAKKFGSYRQSAENVK